MEDQDRNYKILTYSEADEEVCDEEEYIIKTDGGEHCKYEE